MSPQRRDLPFIQNSLFEALGELIEMSLVSGAREMGFGSDSSHCVTEEEEDEDDDSKLHLGTQYSIQEHLDKDKDDESLRKWKEQLLGSVDVTNIGHYTLDPEVKILSLAILSPERPDIVLLGSREWESKRDVVYTERREYTNTVWKTGVKVDRAKEMLGTFSPQLEPYNHLMPQETTPSGMFVRGSYSARTQFLDDDNKCYLEINYSFDIPKRMVEESSI